MRRFLLTMIMVTLLLPAAAQAGPWVPDPGSGYFKAWARWLPGMGYHDADGENQDYAGYHEVGLNFYLEVGVIKSLAVWVHCPLLQVYLVSDLHTDTIDPHVHPGDPSFGVRWGALRGGPVVLALETSVKLPVAPDGPVQDISGPEAGSEKVGQLQVGSGVVDVTWGVSAGISLPASAYLAASIGYVLRTGGYDHDLMWTAEGGIPFLKRWSTRLRFSGRHPLPVGDEELPAHSSPSGIGNGTSYVGFAAELDYKVGGWFVGLSLEGGLFAVKRQSSGPVISAYLARSF